MSFTSTQLQECAPPSLYLAKKTAMCAPKRGRKHLPNTGAARKELPSAKCSSQEKLKRVSYTIPSFAARASSNTTCDPIVLGGPPTFCCPHGPPDGVHIVDLVLESTNLQGVFSRNAFRMREHPCQIDHAPITRMPFGRPLVSILPRLFQVLADALRVNATIERLFLYGNPIGDEGVKAWWLQRG